MIGFVSTSTRFVLHPIKYAPQNAALTQPPNKTGNPYALPSTRVQPLAILPPVQPDILSNHADMKTTTLSTIKTMDEFWHLADESKVNAQYEADECIEFLKEASLEEIRMICLQYRYFVERYPDNLSRLISKMPNQQLKSLLSSILSEELGSGDIAGAHIFWYDRFLRSIGVEEKDLENGIYEENENILSEIEYRCSSKSFQHGVGMVGMGGECLCQIYLTVMYRYLRQNPVMKALSGQVDWEFWTYHVGDADIEHRRLVRECINEMVLGEAGVRDLAMGYSFGKGTWDKFWRNNFKNTRAGKVSHQN